MEQEIGAEFKKNCFTLEDEDQILPKCLTICINYKLTPTDLVSSWDVYSINRQIGQTVQNAHMDAFFQQLSNEHTESIVKKEPGLHLYSTEIEKFMNGELQEDLEEDIPPGTPTEESANKTNNVIYASGKPLDLVTPFGQRKNKFLVQSTLNDLLNPVGVKKEQNQEDFDDDIIKRVEPIRRCSLQIQSSQPESCCRFMYDRIEDKFNFLENRILKFAKDLALGSELYEEPVDPTVASQKSIFAVGMICFEEEGSLKEKPVFLQSSVLHSGGQRVRLDIQNLKQFSIFPGQVVGIEGENPSGHCLVASKIIHSLPLPDLTDEISESAKKQAMDPEFQPSDPFDNIPELSLIIAAGPFTTTDNLFFEPLAELLAYARRKQPQLLVLLGPFVDTEHPEIKKGTVNRTFDEIFQVEVLRKIQDYVEYMGSAARVILMPSVRDANHDCVFPQPPFDIKIPDLKHQIISLPNPGNFCANEVRISCGTVDIVKQLSGQEISRNPPGESKHRLSTLANHIISQRSFYPLYPPAEGTPFDFSLAPAALEITTIPDILILPSDLAHFVKVLSIGNEVQRKCICLNPGRLARGEGGGFFAEIKKYHGTPDSATASVIRI